MSLESSLVNALSGMACAPSCLESAIRFYLGSESKDYKNIFHEISNRLLKDPNDKIRLHLCDYLNKADFLERDAWTEGTLKNTSERRKLIYKRWKIPSELERKIDEDIPIYSETKEALIEKYKDQTPDWYTKEFSAANRYYWSNVVKNLEEKRLKNPRGRSEILKTIASIDSITSSILNRLSNPRTREPKRTKGLVVGYVQSGKTTNFISLIAKAVDSGYKIIIVLAGLTDLLRKQTQKRIDMDLIGVEQIGFSDLRAGTPSDHEYSTDADWPDNFIQYGARPSDIGRLNIDRITTFSNDFTHTSTGTNRLRLNKKNKRAPLFDEDNLQHSDAKIVVVKKENYRLGYLINEINGLTEKERGETPVLIIDDESDQASINTKAEIKEKSKINEKITQIIKLFKRAQYVGYTATPFANVFIDPKNNEDLFPSDFIFSLDRPPNYMGPSQFTDVDEESDGTSQNKKCYVRDVKDENEHEIMQEALDAFLISGAIKCYREMKKVHKFKHHTMLFHQSTSKDDHEQAIRNIKEIWNNSDYDTSRCFIRLNKLFENFSETWQIKGKARGLYFPKNFDDLRENGLSEALGKIRNGDIAIKVNSADDGEAPDFSGARGIWKILIGGAKLSRGYTVEGLTISFFQRNSNTQDTLMQMGRWFGYRDGYEDLIRLYIARNVADKRGREHDLYEKFENLCRDEESFRRRLSIYSSDRRITPEKVPVLVFNSHPFYKPTAKGKMRNAQIISAYCDYREPTKQALNNRADMKHNIKKFKDLLKDKSLKRISVASILIPRDEGIQKQSGEYFVTSISNKEIIGLLNEIRWEGGESQVAPEVRFISENKNAISKWLLVAPIITRSREENYGEIAFGNQKIPYLTRTKASTKTRINAWNSPKDVLFAKWLVSQADIKSVTCDQIAPSQDQGVILFWPVLIKESSDAKPRKDWPAVTGFALAMPKALSPRSATVYSVRQ